VTAGDAAAYFQPGDAADLAKRIEEFLDQPSRRATYATRARDRAPQLLWKHSGCHLVELYRTLLDEHGAVA
jgi:hypothetical protein